MTEVIQNDFIEQRPPVDSVQTRKYAGFWMRFWAFLIDNMIGIGLAFILLTPFQISAVEGYTKLTGHWSLYAILSTLILYAYFVIMTKLLGQTIGKMILGIKVINRDGTKLSWLDVIIREVVGRYIHTALSWLILLYVVVGFTSEKEGIHDIFADTRVIHVDE